MFRLNIVKLKWYGVFKFFVDIKMIFMLLLWFLSFWIVLDKKFVFRCVFVFKNKMWLLYVVVVFVLCLRFILWLFILIIWYCGNLIVCDFEIWIVVLLFWLFIWMILKLVKFCLVRLFNNCGRWFFLFKVMMMIESLYVFMFGFVVFLV